MKINKIIHLVFLVAPSWARIGDRKKLPNVHKLSDNMTKVPIVTLTNGRSGPICPQVVSLQNGAELSVDIMEPSDQESFLASATSAIDIEGLASIGKGEPQVHWTYVIDVSGSTGWPLCGDDSVLECEKAAVLGAHSLIRSGGSAIDFGLSSFASTGTAFQFGGDTYVTTDAPGVLIEDKVNALTANGGTNYAEGLVAALNSVSETTAAKKYIIFLSDGESTQGSSSDFSSALDAIIDEGVTIFPFAIGDNAFCDEGTHGKLEDMGDCKEVDVIDLADELLNLVSTEMISDGLAIDESTVNPSHSVPLPCPGPDDDELTFEATDQSHLEDGMHEVCISVTGRGPESDLLSEETAECCINYYVISFSATPPEETNELGMENSHTVEAMVTGGDNIEDWPVQFAVTGQNAGTIGFCDPADCKTDASGKVTFTYSVPVEPESLGEDIIEASLTVGGSTETVSLKKIWQDTTPPTAPLCTQGPNPAGKVPKAPGKGKKGQNQDGFYTVSMPEDADLVYPNEDLLMEIHDDGSTTVFPLAYKDGGYNIKWTESNATPAKKPGSGAVDFKFKGKGDAVVYLIDPMGNESPGTKCLVPPPPK